MNTMKTVVWAGLATMLLATAVNADVITCSNSLVSSFNINQNLPVQKFDAALGTLNGVTVNVSVTTYGEMGLENTNSLSAITNRKIYTYFPSDPDTNTHGQLGLTLESQTLASVSWSVSSSYTLNLAVYDGVTDYAGTSGWKTTYVNVTDIQSYGYTSADDLAKFTGSGTVDFGVDGTAWFAVGFPSGNVSTFASTNGTATASITYDYTPVPEPATMSLLALGCLAMIRRRNRK